MDWYAWWFSEPGGGGEAPPAGSPPRFQKEQGNHDSTHSNLKNITRREHSRLRGIYNQAWEAKLGLRSLYARTNSNHLVERAETPRAAGPRFDRGSRMAEPAGFIPCRPGHQRRLQKDQRPAHVVCECPDRPGEAPLLQEPANAPRGSIALGVAPKFRRARHRREARPPHHRRQE